MQDGLTRKVERSDARNGGSEDFLERHRAALVTLSGSAAGNEYLLDRPRTTLGRGPGVELPFADETLSREHAAFEVMDGAMQVRDLGSTNGVTVNGAAVLQAELKHGDRIELGDQKFQFLLELRERPPKTYDVSDD